MEEPPNRARPPSFLRQQANAMGGDAPAFDADAAEHLEAIVRAYYNTLLIEPVPAGLLALLDRLDAALKRRA